MVTFHILFVHKRTFSIVFYRIEACMLCTRSGQCFIRCIPSQICSPGRGAEVMMKKPESE